VKEEIKVKLTKKLLMVCLAISLIILSAACSQGKNTVGPGDVQNNGDKVELTFWNTFTLDDREQEILRQRVESFQKEHPEIIIKVESIPHDQYKVKVRTQAAADQLPDLIQVWPGAELEPLVKANLLLPLDDIVGEWKNKLIPEEQMKDYAVNGRQYAIPANKVITHLIYYDKDMLAKVGYSQFPNKYPEFIKMIKKLKENGITPIALGNKGKWVLQSCYLSTIADRFTGSDFLSGVLVGQRKFTDPDFVKALSVIKEMADIGAFNKDMNSLENTQQQQMFLQGKAAMMIEGSWALNGLLAKMPEGKKLGIATFSTVDGGKGDPTALSGTLGYGIAVNSKLDGKKKESAYTFLKYFYQQPLYEELLKAGTLVPAKVEVPSDIPEPFKEVVKRSEGKISPVYDAVLSPTVIDVINNGLQSLVSGQISPEELAQEIQNAVD
jgi:raffinose/stachyose/melibiose transport system substrate-binding protein